MTLKTEEYSIGMEAINNFYSMLYDAMLKSMPEAIFSSSGAYIWRGYRIDKYKDLAFGQYYCQVYPLDTKNLLFQEGYLDASRKSTEFEWQHGLQQGRYYYPFTEKLDLIHTRFFDLSKDEQFITLKRFISNAAEQAILWQKSEARKEVTGKKYQKGKMPRFVPVDIDLNYDHVGIEYLQAWEYQTELLKKLQTILEQFKGREWVRPNASIYNFGFRGMRLKFKSNSFTSRWSVYFNDFERLRFRIPNGKQNSYNLVEHGYFDLSADEQTKQLTNFAKASLGMNI